MFNDDLRYCVLRVNDQRQYTEQTQGPTAWTDSCSFLVDSITTDKVSVVDGGGEGGGVDCRGGIGGDVWI